MFKQTETSNPINTFAAAQKTLACAFSTLEKNTNPEQWTLQKEDFPPMQILSITHNGMNSSFYPYSFFVGWATKTCFPGGLTEDPNRFPLY